MRCFCPPETKPPPTPTSLSYPLSMRDTNSCAFAICAASTTSARVAGAPKTFPAAMLSCTVPENSVGSCSTSPIHERSHSGSNARTSTPSSATTPAPAESGTASGADGTTETDARTGSAFFFFEGAAAAFSAFSFLASRSASIRALSASGVTGS